MCSELGSKMRITNGGLHTERVIFINSLPQEIEITNAEYFISTSDPGAGSASALIVFDGQFDEAIERVTQK